MGTVEILLGGMGVVKSLLLLLLRADDESMKKERVKYQVDEYMKRLGNEPHELMDIREMITWIVDDNFKKETVDRKENQHYLKQLQSLKDTIIDFYFKHLVDITATSSGQRVCDVHARLGQYVLQLERFRMVIEPDIQISKNVHPVTGFPYLAAKTFWMENSGKKVRKFTKSLGRAENYPDGIKDKEAETEGLTKMQEVLYARYLEEYPT